ncbi:MAG: hypothetical protein JZU53_07110 [Paludibacter sp.]|nr:hypothetical protein [Paludibacter sp.]
MSNKKQYTIDITEAKAVKLFDEKYGRDLASRFLKLQEEFIEFKEALEEFMNNPTPENLAHLKDEKSDLHTVDIHISNMLGLCSEQMLDMAIDKVKGREKDPGYKRYPKIK